MKLLKELVVMTTTIICGLIMVSSCSSDSFESQKPAMLTIEATNLKLVVGETEARVATTNSDGAVTYISSDVAVSGCWRGNDYRFGRQDCPLYVCPNILQGYCRFCQSCGPRPLREMG